MISKTHIARCLNFSPQPALHRPKPICSTAAASTVYLWWGIQSLRFYLVACRVYFALGFAAILVWLHWTVGLQNAVLRWELNSHHIHQPLSWDRIYPGRSVFLPKDLASCNKRVARHCHCRRRTIRVASLEDPTLKTATSHCSWINSLYKPQTAHCSWFCCQPFTISQS